MLTKNIIEALAGSRVFDLFSFPEPRDILFLFIVLKQRLKALDKLNLVSIRVVGVLLEYCATKGRCLETKFRKSF